MRSDIGTPITDKRNHDSTNSGELLRWAITAATVLVLVYPLALWLRETDLSGATDPSLSAAEAALQNSVEAYQSGRYQEAIDAATTALAEKPDLAQAYNNIAVSYLQLRRYDEGIAAVQEALRLEPDFEMARNNLAWIEREKAAAARDAATEPLMDEGINQLYTQRDPNAAVDLFRQVMAINPEHYGANYQLAAALQQAGQLEEARQQWIKTLAMARAIKDEETAALIMRNMDTIHGDTKPER